eukprot:4292681-Amphidinium_carterae.1
MAQTQTELVIYCDNAAVTQLVLVSHLNASSTRTRRLSMRGAWLHDLHQKQALCLFFIDTNEQKADALTKCLGATLNERSREQLCLTLVALPLLARVPLPCPSYLEYAASVASLAIALNNPYQKMSSPIFHCKVKEICQAGGQVPAC